MPVVVSSPRFVGRAGELDRLAALLAGADAGSAATVVLGGEAGVGKTRLLREFADRAGAVTVLWGGCVDTEDTGPPFAPFAQALRTLHGELDAAARHALFAPGRRELARLVPELDGGAEGTDGSRFDLGHAPQASPSAQARLFEFLLGLLTRLAATRPVVLALEDMHWADRSTRDLFGYLVRNLVTERVLLLATYRSDELTRGHPLRPVLAELDRSRAVERMELPRFTRAEVAEQVGAILGGVPDPAVVDAVYHRSEGNAFYAEELVAAGDRTDDLPPSLRDIVLARVEGLPRAAQEVIGVVAVAGRRVGEHLLAAVAPMEDAERAEGLKAAITAQVLLLERPDTYTFRHALVQEAVYGELLPQERTQLHLAYGRALSERPELGGGPVLVAAELAHHWHAAHDLPRALAASVHAAEVAHAGYGFAEALGHYERALELWPGVPDAAPCAGRELADLRDSAAAAANLAGDHTRAAALVRSALASVDTRTEPTRAGLLNRRLGRYLWAAGNSRDALDAYEEAVRLVPATPQSAARARVLAAQGQALMLISRFDAARRSCEEAVDIATQVGARAEEGHARNTLGFALACLGEPERGVTELEAARAIAEEVGDLDDLARAYLNLSELLVGPLNRLDDGLALALEGVEVTGRLGLAQDYGVSLAANAANALYGMGRWDEALALLAEAELHHPVEMAATDLHQAVARILVSRGADAAAEERLRRARRLMDGTIDPQYQAPLAARAAELALWQGRPERARSAVTAGLAHLVDTEDAWLAGPLLWLGACAEADAVVRARADRDAAAVADGAGAVEALRAHGDAVLSGIERRGRLLPPLTAAYADLMAAEVDRFHGRDDPATWLSAAEDWAALGHPFIEAYARGRAAAAFLIRRRRQEARAELRVAHELARSLGAEPLRRRLTQLAERARIDLDADLVDAEAVAAGPGRPPAARLGLTAREHEVLALVAAGRTNREIADELFVSGKTAATHVSNILAKLGVRTRGEAAATAHQLGLLGSH
ncbi:helix-turn-helix transcriptional regulator [Pseudonocardia saturnea]